ncbi:MAG: DUF4124 domain-containing protein [Gammaproteobacteria bacterium]|nr:DUF4124 domain-containing protein [Gammaproteobacteria bacterium]
MRAATAIAVSLGLVTSIATHADVYRWVDARNEVHYSDRWVPGSELIKVDRSHAQTSTAPTARAPQSNGPPKGGEEPPRDRLAEAATADAVRSDVAKKRSEECDQARERYEKSIAARRIFKTGPKGEREYLTDAQADEYRLAARRDMDAACGSTPAR